MSIYDNNGLEELGKELERAIGHSDKPILLYMEAEEGWSSGYVYVDEGNYLSHLPINRDLWTKLYDEWEALPADERWSVIRYYLAEGKFNVSFRYKGETALVFDSVERASRDDAIAREFFGDKPIHYPPPPAHAFDLSDERQGFDGPLG